MGFSSCFFVYPKVVRNGRTLNFSEIKTVEDYLGYENNDWAKKNYKTAEEYALVGYHNDIKGDPDFVLCEVAEELRIFYEFHNHALILEYGSTCSSGIPFSEMIEQKYDCVNAQELSITDAMFNEIKEMTWDYICEHMPEPVEVDLAYKYDFSRDEENPDIILTPVDGIEVNFDDGSSKRLDTVLEGSEVYVRKNYISSWDWYAWLAIYDGLLAIDKLMLYGKGTVPYCIEYCWGC